MLAQEQVELFLVKEVSKIMGVDQSDLDLSASLLDSGADSLLLVELLQSINDQFGVSIAVGKVFSELTSINQMTLFIENELLNTNPVLTEITEEPVLEMALPILNEDKHSFSSEAFVNNSSKSSLENIVQQQLQIMTRHLELLKSNKTIGNTTEVTLKNSNVKETIINKPSDSFDSNLTHELTIDDAEVSGRKSVDRFNLFDKRNEEDNRLADELKNTHISKLIDVYTLRTSASKAETQSARKVLADNRASAGFRMSLKEMVYPILSDRTDGSHIWDIDGNEYIDFTMGFGTHLFGHSPDFAKKAIEAQFKIGMPIGPQSPLAGKVASLFCKLTKQDRVVFCNTGSEATMTAVRLARAASGRDKIAIFSGSYHGTFDGFLARRKSGTDVSFPVATGVIKSMVENVVVLDYGNKSALDYIKKHGSELAAVIIEPVQSRHLSNQPKEFLTQVRALTLDSQTAFIWDEVITGFRIAPGGAQEYFGIQADIATYGKILGGGMPVGAVGGKAKYLDYIDGGWWQYGDESYPQSDMTFFAGTFSKHPLTMAASLSVLKHIEKQGPKLQKKLGDITASMAQQLNRFFDKECLDIRIEYFGSLFRFESSGNLDLLFLHLMTKGIFIWEGRNCFISTAHSDNDIVEFIKAVEVSVLDLKKDHLAPMSTTQNAQQEKLLSASQKRFFDLSEKGSEGNRACNICVGLRLEGKLDKAGLEKSISRVIKRHESLHANFLGNKQRICWDSDAVDFPFIKSTEMKDSTKVEDWLAMDQKQEFQLGSGPLYRFKLYELGGDLHVLSIAVHHLICDGMAMVILIDELRRLYDAELQGVSAGLPPAESYSQWVSQEKKYIDSAEYKA
jgi:glutamate-1-semialdehyde aminotransferase/acyl carrier protein